jgi:ATP-dependent DNA helicase PIF1
VDLTGGSSVTSSVARSANTAARINHKVSSFATSSIATSTNNQSATVSSSLILKHHKEESKPRINPTTLNADQSTASAKIFSGSNAFLTGAAGVGKSYLLNYLIQGLKEKYTEECVVVAAATGIAATHIGGVTIHSWAGVRLGVGGAKVLVPRVLGNMAACARWRKAKVLILDEVCSWYFGSNITLLSCLGCEHKYCWFDLLILG